MKTCTKCNTLKPNESFYLQSRYHGKTYTAECKACAVSRHQLKRKIESLEDKAHHETVAKEYREKNKPAISATSRKGNLKKYGITKEEYTQIEQNQKGVCAICSKPEKTEYKNNSKHLSIDHCHETGKVRGLLCGNCNRGLGLFRDSPENLKAAAEYIKRNK